MASILDNVSGSSNYLLESKTSLGYRELIILTLGTVTNSNDRFYLYDRFRLLARQPYISFLGHLINFEIFNDMLNKLIRNNILVERYNESNNKYFIELTNQGLGELDSMLFNNEELENYLLRFSYLGKK